MRTTAVLGLVLAATACGTPVQDPDMRPRSPADTHAPVALGALQTRDFKVTFLTGDRVAVEDARGVMLARGITLAELQKVDPFLYAACANAMARNGTYLDARLDARPAVDADDARPR